ncbi:zinc finger protein 648 [Colossoma macropomum]|uniref:zinc finger protein 648 n=1 Tax=Colossoma macropomum TaxID=42526 RepID=UPI00186426F2|nr:zinc finger protein 648 [Colossoma macropomum]
MNMAENCNHLKPDILSNRAYMSKRSIRKTFINKRRYLPVESEVTADSKCSEGAFSLHCAEETLSSAACANGMSPVYLNPATSVHKRFTGLPYANKSEVVSQKAGLEHDLTASANHTAEGEEVPSSANIKVKLEEDSDLAPAPETQQDAPAASDRDAAKAPGEHGPSRGEQSARPLFMFTAMKKRRGAEGDAENRPYKCTYCPWAFKKYSNLLSHIDTHNGLKPYVCDLCGKAYSHQGTLQQHKRLHTGERPYSCPFCDKTYTWSSDYRKHIRTHTGEKPYACEACGKEFVRSSDLRKHERNMHANDKPFPCKKCGKTFNKPLSLMRHERTHLGERPFLCPECGKAFAVASRMAEHRKIHTGLRPYTCHICSKSFTKSSNLAEHLSIHTGLRPHMCSECGLAFAMPSRLLRHQRTHAGIRPYECRSCGKSFSRPTALQRHLLQQQCDSKVFMCSQCGASFSCNTQLADHMLSHGAAV